ncbi:MAG: hypothetical protein JJ896_12435 [Rhodothermales bacterium]|nr:hypothetical protein [Rhodothermales bacterium]MBO6780453.1 hypothetical protein [Rhodothermales bacterium]
MAANADVSSEAEAFITPTAPEPESLEELVAEPIARHTLDSDAEPVQVRSASHRGRSLLTFGRDSARPTFNIRSFYESQGATPPTTTVAAAPESDPGVTRLPATPDVAGALPGSLDTMPETTVRQESSERGQAEASRTDASPAATSNSGFQGGSEGSDRQDRGFRLSDTAAASPQRTASAQADPIFEMPPVDAAIEPEIDPAALLDHHLIDIMDEWFGEETSMLTQKPQGPRGRMTVANAWLRAMRSSMEATAPQSGNEWKEVTIELEDGLGSVNIRARREAEQLSVQILASDLNTSSRLSAATDRLQDQLRDRYGADVDLSFGSESQTDQSSGRRETEGASNRNQSTATSDAGTEGDEPDSSGRRGADNVWVG